VVTPGSWTGSTNWQVYKLSEGGGGGLTLGETSSTAYRGDRGKVAYDHSQTTGNPHGTTASDVGLSNVPNVATDDQTPTFTTASSRNNLVSGEKLSVMLGKISKFFNDLKTVAFSGSYTDLTNQPQINGNTLTGNKTTGDLGINADNVMMSDGVTSVEDALEALNQETIISITADGVKTYGQYFTELYNAIHNYNGIRKQSLTLQIGVRIFNLSYFYTGEYQFSMFAVGTYVFSRGVVLSPSACSYRLAQNTTITNLINDVPASGEIITVYQ
jgi:hypothetical protein